MTYVNRAFPDCIAFGAQSAAVWMTHIAQSIGGFVAANQSWEDNLHHYDVSFAVRTVNDYADVRTHFNEMRGRAHTFPFKDYLDFTLTTSDGVLLTAGLAAVTANGTYYVHKKYGTTNPYYRRITRPVNPLVIRRTRSAVVSIITPTITYSTGAVAITGHVSGDTYSVAGEFNVPCRYDTDRLPAAIINKKSDTAGELLVSCDAIGIVEDRDGA